MDRQLELDFNTRRAAAIRKADADALTLGALLRREGRRMTAAEIAAELDWEDRRVRAAAEACGGAVLSAPGIAGYRLASATAVADYYAQERLRYRSQIRAMARRLIAMDQAVHGAAAAGSK